MKQPRTHASQQWGVVVAASTSQLSQRRTNVQYAGETGPWCREENVLARDEGCVPMLTTYIPGLPGSFMHILINLLNL